MKMLSGLRSPDYVKKYEAAKSRFEKKYNKGQVRDEVDIKKAEDLFETFKINSEKEIRAAGSGCSVVAEQDALVKDMHKITDEALSKMEVYQKQYNSCRSLIPGATGRRKAVLEGAQKTLSNLKKKQMEEMENALAAAGISPEFRKKIWAMYNTQVLRQLEGETNSLLALERETMAAHDNDFQSELATENMVAFRSDSPSGSTVPLPSGSMLTHKKDAEGRSTYSFSMKLGPNFTADDLEDARMAAIQTTDHMLRTGDRGPLTLAGFPEAWEKDEMKDGISGKVMDRARKRILEIFQEEAEKRGIQLDAGKYAYLLSPKKPLVEIEPDAPTAAGSCSRPGMARA